MTLPPIYYSISGEGVSATMTDKAAVIKTTGGSANVKFTDFMIGGDLSAGSQSSKRSVDLSVKVFGLLLRKGVGTLEFGPDGEFVDYVVHVLGDDGLSI